MRKRRGVPGARLPGAERTEGGVRLTIERQGKAGAAAAPEIIEAELLLSAVGRRPVTEGIGLEALGIELERGYVKINPLMQTNLPHVYAIGDVVDTPWLAHVASAEGILAVEHMAGKTLRPINHDPVPSCTYCGPEAGRLGRV